MNKETLEEAAERISKEHYVDQSDYWAVGIDSFKRGAKWQEERMYSEKELNHIEWIYNRMVFKHNENPNYDYMIKFKSLIEQFKKKQNGL